MSALLLSVAERAGNDRHDERVGADALLCGLGLNGFVQVAGHAGEVLRLVGHSAHDSRDVLYSALSTNGLAVSHHPALYSRKVIR